MPTEFWVVDRVEAGRAVLVADDGTKKVVELRLLPPGTREGSVLQFVYGSDLTPGEWTIDDAEAHRRLDEASQLLEDLKNRDPGGDIDL